MLQTAMLPVRRMRWPYAARTSTGCIAAGLFLLLMMDHGGAQYIGRSGASDMTVSQTEEMKSGLNAIPTDLPVHASTPSPPVNRPFSLLPGTIPAQPVMLEDTDRPSLAEQYRMEKQGIKRAPSRATSVRRDAVTKSVSGKHAIEATSRAGKGSASAPVTVVVSSAGTETGMDGDLFAIQLGAFHDTISAQTYWASFMIRYPDLVESHPRSLTTADLGTKGIFHRLRLGGFADMISAETKCRQLLADGTDCFATPDR
ncbi:SPOR domain-containing protein [Thalassospira australica]|uniref:SPOR domain-containing protein n=1 Tax=Thalassospira australica TaxID=1528106 RepID=UPI003850A5FF